MKAATLLLTIAALAQAAVQVPASVASVNVEQRQRAAEYLLPLALAKMIVETNSTNPGQDKAAITTAETGIKGWLASWTKPNGQSARKDVAPPKFKSNDDEGLSDWLGELMHNIWTGNYMSAPIGKWFASKLPVQRLDRKVKMEPRVRKDGTSKRYKALYGPINLVAKDASKPSSNMVSLDPNGQAFIHVITEGICKNCTILAGQSGLVYDDLSPVGSEDGVYIHHVITQDLTKPQIQPVTICDTNLTTQNTPNAILNRFRTMAGSGFVGQGDDNGGSPILFTTADGKFDSGFHTGLTDKYVLYLDMVNYTNSTKKVYFTMDIEYVDGHSGGEAISTLISVTGCNFFKDPVAKEGQRSVTRSGNFPVLQDGAMITAKGHMHDGGESMVLYLNDKMVCESKAKYGPGAAPGSETIAEMSWCPDIIPVKKGDLMKMESVYNLKDHPLRASTSDSGGMNMGSMGGMDLMGMWAIVWALDPKMTEDIEW